MFNYSRPAHQVSLEKEHYIYRNKNLECKYITIKRTFYLISSKLWLFAIDYIKRGWKTFGLNDSNASLSAYWKRKSLDGALQTIKTKLFFLPFPGLDKQLQIHGKVVLIVYTLLRLLKKKKSQTTNYTRFSVGYVLPLLL